VAAFVILAGQFVTAFGNSAYLVAILVAAARYAPDPINIGMIQASAYAPVFFLAVLGGTLADRLNRGALIALTDILRALCLGAAALALDRFGVAYLMPIIIPLVLCNGSMQAIFSPALVSLSLDLQKKHAYPMDILSLRTAIGHAASLVGQILGGIFVLEYGLLPLLLANGIGFFLSGISELSLLGTAGRVKAPLPRAAATGPRPTIFVPLKKLWAELRRAQALGAPILTYAGFQIGAAFIMVSLPLFLQTRMGLREEYLGYSMAAMLAGSIIAALLMGGFGNRIAPERHIRFSRFAAAAAAAAAFALSLLGPGSQVVYLGILVLSGMAAGYVHLLTLQLTYRFGAPGTAASRQGAIEALTAGILPLAYLLGGVAAARLGTRIEWMFRGAALLLIWLACRPGRLSPRAPVA